ncbi:hypothetical protein AQUSIP_25960 [Aquicella siphonis]|uniref:DUF378 domain-containing protein n=1 Tax=Aquicella siphonis TaxID=254247 RepID=A0A5E4PJK6_9COXI|nr:DUF378 domain-containing protein [Aquicella siphonis]VVC77269.1 hypothetical protein AQUSIP_25960 [Aquicella siphonis]
MLKELGLYDQIALIVVVLGGIFWGLVGLFNLFLVTAILGNFLGRIIYIGVGVAAGWLCYQIYLEKMKKA